MPFPYKLGKKPARPHAIKLRFSSLADRGELPQPPKRFGHEHLVSDWQMLGNDQYGCCVLSGAAHEHMLWTRMGEATDCGFTDRGVLEAYSAITGFDPARPDTDQGTDMKQAASWRRHVGIMDDAGNRHPVAAYLAIDPGDVVAHYQALWLFGALGIGFEVPASAMDQFMEGRPWSVVRGSPVEGGHYVPLIAKRNMFKCVSWGRSQNMTIPFFYRYNDESVVYVTQEALTNRKSPEGFDYDTLVRYLASLPAR